MFTIIWRFFVTVFNWRGVLRMILRRKQLDVVFISNMRDDDDRKNLLGWIHPSKGHFNGQLFWLKGKISGRLRLIDAIAEDLVVPSGRKKAQNQFLAAVKWAQKRGVKVILLAASTKRLFGRDGEKLKNLFPDLTFTIGDNGTAILLLKDTLRALRKAGLFPDNSRIGILGPYGILGEVVTEFLVKVGYHVIGAGSDVTRLENMAKSYGIEICQNFEEMDKVDAVIACTHSEKIRITADNEKLIRRQNQKLLVIDVAEPANLSIEEYEKCNNVVIRQDAGNAYNPDLEYVLGRISYKRLRLTNGVIFGCFAESLALALALEQGEDIKNIDWFSVNNQNIDKISKLFERYGFQLPSPVCFGEPVTSFNLSLEGLKEYESKLSAEAYEVLEL